MRGLGEEMGGDRDPIETSIIKSNIFGEKGELSQIYIWGLDLHFDFAMGLEHWEIRRNAMALERWGMGFY